MFKSTSKVSVPQRFNLCQSAGRDFTAAVLTHSTFAMHVQLQLALTGLLC